MAEIIPDITFINTHLYSEAARHFDKYGCYTKLHPEYDKREFKMFWDEEEKRRKEGFSVGGVRITGDHYSYLNYNRIQLLNVKTKGQAAELGGKLKLKGEKKEFFPSFWDGDYHYYHAVQKAREEGKHVCVGKARRKGYSYKNANIAVNKYDLIPKSITVIGAFDSKYLYPAGTMSMVKTGLTWLNKHTDWKKSRLIDREDHYKSGIVINKEDYGYLSQIIAVTFKDNASAARGKDGTLILMEEAGMFPNLVPSYIATQSTVEDGAYTTGQILIFGTGGGKDSDWKGFEELFYNPDKYNLLAFDNVWDEDGEGTTCGFFVPTTRNMSGFMDAEGNSKLKDATDYVMSIRTNMEKNNAETDTLDTYAMENPLCPSEAFKRSSNNIFPAILIDRRLNKLKHDGLSGSLQRAGSLVRESTGVRLVTNQELRLGNYPYHPPVNSYPNDKNKDLTGCIVEWASPHTIGGRVPENLYRIWHDPYAVDKDSKDIRVKDSLGAAYVYQRLNNVTGSKGNVLVASYIGRPSRVDDYNEQLFLLAERYNAKIFFENDRGDVLGYAKRKKLIQYLEEEPTMLLKKESSASRVSRDFGMSMGDGTGRVKGNAAIFLRDLLTEVVSTDSITKEQKIFLDYIFDEGLLEELLKWNTKGNFDRVSALLVGMYDLKEQENIQVKVSKQMNKPNSFFNRPLY